MNKIKILNVQFNSIKLKEAVGKCLNLIQKKGKYFFVTPNPEILLKSQKDSIYQHILNQADLSIPDGAGIVWASKFLKTSPQIKERVTGTDLLQEICLKLKKDQPIFLLGGTKGVAKKAGEILKQRNPNLKIGGTYEGTPLKKEENKIIKKINQSKAIILFVAYGAPIQEIWIYRNLPKFKNIHLAGGIGGAFDFIAGKRKRAPLLIRQFNLEWLYRLIQEPKRINRIFNAVIIFPIKVFRSKKESK